jgi:aminoglycoside phosphotransferase (APT) family kinase protein
MTDDGSLPGLNLAALTGYLRDHVDGFSGAVSAELVEGGRSNLTYRIDDGDRSWALRRPPLGTVAQSANDVVREFRVVSALSVSGVPPVPTPVLACSDLGVLGAPFTLVQWVDGVVLRDPLVTATIEPAAAVRLVDRLVDGLADLHSVDVEAVGLASFGRPVGYLARQVSRWRRQWDVVATRPSDQVDRLHQALADVVPAQSPPGIVHGDYRLDNVLFDADLTEILAVIDWEMATVGDPLADVGLMLVYWSALADEVLPHGNPALGFDPRIEADYLAGRYAERSGRDLANLSFYRALGCFKLAVIAEGIHGRYLDGYTVGSGFETVGASVPGLLSAGLGFLDSSAGSCL